MRSEEEIRGEANKLLEQVVTTPLDNIDETKFDEARSRLDTLLWVLEDFEKVWETISLERSEFKREEVK